MKKSKLFLIAMLMSVFTFAVTAHAELLRVLDNDGLLNRVDQFLGESSFEQAYKCGTYAVHWRARILDGVRTEVVKCSDKRVVIRSSSGKDETVTRSSFEVEKGNPARILTNQLRRLGNDVRGLPAGSYLSIENFAVDKVTLGSGEVIDTASVDVSVVRPSGRPIGTFKITSGRNLPAVARMISVTSSQASPPVMYQLLEHGEVAAGGRRGD